MITTNEPTQSADYADVGQDLTDYVCTLPREHGGDCRYRYRAKSADMGDRDVGDPEACGKSAVF